MTTYDTITVPAGQIRRVKLSSGETHANKLYDITASGAGVIFEAMASNWTMRDIGVKGQQPGDENFLKICVTNSGATGTIERCYFGDGSRPGSVGGIYVMTSPAHRGTLTFDRVNMAHSSNNGMYGSGPGYKGQPGLIHVKDSYFYSNNISNVRLGGPGGTSRVENTTIYVDSSVNGCHDNCSSPGAINARGVWAWAGKVAVSNCDVNCNGYGKELVESNGGSITQTNSRIGAGASRTPPDGVPLSAADAASGGATGDQTYDHLLVIDGDGSEASYTFNVTGADAEIVASAAEGGTFNSVDDQIAADGKSASGKVYDAVDAYEFNGTLDTIRIQGTVERVELDGTAIPESDYRESGNGDSGEDDSGNDGSEPAPTPEPEPEPEPPDSGEGGSGEGGSGPAPPDSGDTDSGTGDSGNDGDDTAPMPSYETIKVPANTTRSFSIGSGQTWANKLIDITAPGANYRINASGNGWTIKNIGVKGYYQTGAKVSPIILRTSGGHGTVENVYLGDGGGGSSTGIFVLRTHSGDININRVNVQGWPDNGIYASAPGNGSDHPAPGGKGTVRIHNSYSANNRISNFRLGTNGSYLKNCVAVGGEHRSFWGYYAHTRIIDSSLSGPKIVVGEKAWQGGHTARVTAENSAFSGYYTTRPTNGFTGRSTGNFRSSPPEGVPRSPAEAASGGSKSTPTPPPDPEPTPEPTGEHTLLIGGADQLTNYTVVVNSEIRAWDANGRATFDHEDAISDDGTTATGGVHGGYDAYAFDGEIQRIELDGPLRTLEYDGAKLDPDQFRTDLDTPDPDPEPEPEPDPEPEPEPTPDPEPDPDPEMHTLEVRVATQHEQGERRRYIFAAEEVQPGENLEDTDRVYALPGGDEVARGYLWTGGPNSDVWNVSQPLYLWDDDGDLEVLLDGSPVDPEDILADSSK